MIDRFHVHACVLKREGNPNIRECVLLKGGSALRSQVMLRKYGRPACIHVRDG